MASRASVLDRLDAALVLAPEEAMLLESVRALAVGKIAPRAAQYDQSGEFPWDNIAAINALGLNAMFAPADYGGAAAAYTA